MVPVHARIGNTVRVFYYATNAQANAAIIELRQMGIPANR